MNLHLPGLAVIIGIYFLSSSLPQATSGLVSPCIMDTALCESNRQKSRKLGWCRFVLQYVPCTLKFLPHLLKSPPSQPSLSPSCLWPPGTGNFVLPATSYQNSPAGTILCIHSSISLQPRSTSSPPFSSPSPLQRYNRQQILCTDDSTNIPITITKQKFKPLLPHLQHCGNRRYTHQSGSFVWGLITFNLEL